VHFVAPDVDAGPIVAQARVDVLPGDDEASLAARVLEAEHRLLPQVVGWFCAGRLVIARGQVHVKGDSGTAAAAPNSAAAPN
jgi:phosphoribosylglycinamide formyltransferase-1